MYRALKKVLRVAMLIVALVLVKSYLEEHAVLNLEHARSRLSPAQWSITADPVETHHDIKNLSISTSTYTEKLSFIHDWNNTILAEVREEKNSISIKDEKNLGLTTKDLGKKFAFIEERRQMRLDKVKQSCLTNVNTTLQTNHKPIVRALMNPSHDITYCPVNSAASKYVVDILRETFNCTVDLLEAAAYEILHMPYFEMRAAVALSYSFTIVREPYGRLFSTYRNNFFFPNSHWDPIGPEIVKRYRRNPSMDELLHGHNVTFHEMIRFTVEEFEAGQELDEHLRPMNEECYPCDYQYDFIGKLETIDSDLDYLKALWSKTKHINIRQEARKGKGDFYKTSQILDTLDLIIGSNISQYKLYLRAWSYFQITGKIYKYIRMPFTEETAITYGDFERALEVASDKSKRFAKETQEQQLEALKQAYGSVPLELLERLSKVVALDCSLYGYEKKPNWLFNRNDEQIFFFYFKGLK